MEVTKISELDRLKLENIKLKMSSLQQYVNQYYMLDREAYTIVKLFADTLKVKPEQIKIDPSTGVYEIMPEKVEAPKEKKDHANESSRRKSRK